VGPDTSKGSGRRPLFSQIVLAPLALGYGPAFAINTVSYASSAVLLRGLRVPGRPEKVQRRRLLAEAREGVAVLVHHRLLRALALGQFLAALSAGATSGREPHRSAGEQPQGDRPAGHLDRVWPDTDPAGKSLVAASRA